jgi:hypothetical protein
MDSRYRTRTPFGPFHRRADDAGTSSTRHTGRSGQFFHTPLTSPFPVNPFSGVHRLVDARTTARLGILTHGRRGPELPLENIVSII